MIAQPSIANSVIPIAIAILVVRPSSPVLLQLLTLPSRSCSRSKPSELVVWEASSLPSSPSGSR